MPRVQVSHPLTKSLTKISKKWPWASTIYEQLGKRTSLDSSFSQALFVILVYMWMLQVKITFRWIIFNLGWLIPINRARRQRKQRINLGWNLLTCNMYNKIVTESTAWNKAWISSWPIIKFSLKFSANYKQIKRRISVCQKSLEPVFHALLQFFTLFNCDSHGFILNTL